MLRLACGLIAITGLLLLSAVPTPAVAGAPNPDLLEFVLEAHKAARESIHTASCKVTFVFKSTVEGGESRVTISEAGEYWYSSDAIRVKASRPDGRKTEYVWRDGICKSLSEQPRPNKPMVTAMLSAMPERFVMSTRVDAFVCGLLAPPREPLIQRRVAENLVGDATKVKSVEKKTVDGKEVIVVLLLFEKSKQAQEPWDIEIHFDPSVNYLIRRTIATATNSKNETLRAEHEVIQFKECLPGVFFPERSTRRYTSNGNLLTTWTADIADIRLNEALPGDIFDFSWPDGITLTDTIKGVSYKIDSMGNALSKENALLRHPPHNAGNEKATPKLATTVEPQPGGSWILPWSAAILLVGVVAYTGRWWWRRWRRFTPTKVSQHG
ncbi:MAG TPA: hypothetical protein VE988_05235 [Gemmataceae bacterium]|nr:hypothetical protein [Gemmataceae bacterium]